MDTRPDDLTTVASPSSDPGTGGPNATDLERENARRRIKRRRDLQGGAIAYVVINAFLVGVWAMTGRGYFWPGWVLAGWGVGMVLGWFDYVRGPVTERDIDRELDRTGRDGTSSR